MENEKLNAGTKIKWSWISINQIVNLVHLGLHCMFYADTAGTSELCHLWIAVHSRLWSGFRCDYKLALSKVFCNESGWLWMKRAFACSLPAPILPTRLNQTFGPCGRRILLAHHIGFHCPENNLQSGYIFSHIPLRFVTSAHILTAVSHKWTLVLSGSKQ